MPTGCLSCYGKSVRCVFVLVAAFSLGIPMVARAESGESALSLTSSFASFTAMQSGEDRIGLGGLVALDYQRGIGDTFWLRGAVGGGAFAAEGKPGYAATAAIGITYAIDILRYVPYVGIGLGAVCVGGGALEPQVRPILELGIGLDVIESQNFSWGLDVRLSSFVKDITFFSIGPRVTWKWGYF